MHRSRESRQKMKERRLEKRRERRDSSRLIVVALEEREPAPPCIFGPPKRTKLLKDVTAMDFPRGYTAEDVATDAEDA